MAYLGQAGPSQIDGGSDESGTDGEIGTGESPSTGEGGASFPRPEKHLPPSKNAVLRAAEKARPASWLLRPCQPLLGSASVPQPPSAARDARPRPHSR